MLIPAIQYKDEIEKEFQRIQYSEKYLWYTGSIDNYDMEVKTEGDKFAFAIVFQDELIGYVSFRVDWYCSMAYNFSLIKFKDIEGRGRMICKDVFKIANKSKLAMASAIREVINMSYESPITAIYEQISNQINQDFENRVMAEVKMKVDVNVNKEELLKALNYDRDQYQKGMEDAKRVLMPMCRYLGKCMSHPEISREYYDYCDLYHEDCNCQCICKQI